MFAIPPTGDSNIKPLLCFMCFIDLPSNGRVQALHCVITCTEQDRAQDIYQDVESCAHRPYLAALAIVQNSIAVVETVFGNRPDH